ncbi:MAG TPA: DUF3228 family protein [Myxococcales bacterium]|nr:DUF3228 family protein [Myxococcales bacterium]
MHTLSRQLREGVNHATNQLHGPSIHGLGLACKQLHGPKCPKEGISIDADWGVVNIAMHMSAEESPMAPATVTRNALGRELGGNGAAFCLVTNEAGADYYRRFVLVK